MQKPSSGSGRFHASEGDWVCSKEDCENVNFARRDKCNKCGRAKGSSYIVKNAGSEIGSKFAEKSKGLFSADDWQCSKCSNINWARRTTCNVCNAPKVGPDENRTGFGGGFKENEGVIYNERQDDSDGEYDEFGRKKKKYRGKLPSKEEEREEKKAVVKEQQHNYDDEEEEDDDDDEDGDLSKYNLSSSDEDDKPPPAPRIIGRSRPSAEGSSSSDKRDRSRSPISRR